MADTDFDACRKLWENVFGDTKEYTDFYFSERAKTGRIYTKSDGKKLVSMVHANPYTMLDSRHHTFHRLHYIVGVATHPNYRHRGFMADLLTRALQDMYEDKEPFTYLMPADPAIYAPFGFCYIDSKLKECCRLDQWRHLSAGSPSCRMEAAAPASYQAISVFANSHMQAKGYNYIFRNAAYYGILQKQMQAAGGELLCYVTPAGRKEAAPVIHAVISYMFEDNHCEITECLYRDAVSFSDIQNAFAEYAAARHHIHPAASVRLTLYDRQEPAASAADAKNAVFSPAVMGRIVDFKSFVKLLYAQENTSLSLCIKDPLLPANSGCYELFIDRNGGSITSRLPLPQNTDNTEVLTPNRAWEALRPHLSEFCINDVT